MLTYHHSLHRGVKTETPVVQRVTPWRLPVSEKRGRRRRRSARGEPCASLSLSSLYRLFACGSGSAIFREIWVKCCLLRSSCYCEVFLRVRILVLAFVLWLFPPPLLLFAKFSSICELSALYSSVFLFWVRVPPPSGGSVCLSDATIPAKFCFYRVVGFPFLFLWFCLCCVTGFTVSSASRRVFVVVSSSS
jgi:hypothetical protein